MRLLRISDGKVPVWRSEKALNAIWLDTGDLVFELGVKSKEFSEKRDGLHERWYLTRFGAALIDDVETRNMVEVA